jgi:hypothetical protein
MREMPDRGVLLAQPPLTATTAIAGRGSTNPRIGGDACARAEFSHVKRGRPPLSGRFRRGSTHVRVVNINDKGEVSQFQCSDCFDANLDSMRRDNAACPRALCPTWPGRSDITSGAFKRSQLLEDGYSRRLSDSEASARRVLSTATPPKPTTAFLTTLIGFPGLIQLSALHNAGPWRAQIPGNGQRSDPGARARDGGPDLSRGFRLLIELPNRPIRSSPAPREACMGAERIWGQCLLGTQTFIYDASSAFCFPIGSSSSCHRSISTPLETWWSSRSF